MSTKKKKKLRKSSPTHRRLRELMDEYAEIKNATTVNLCDVAEWALSTLRFIPPKADARKKLVQDLSAAAREDYIEDDNGEPVRRRHAYKTTTGNGQQTLWINIEDATPQVMKLCVSLRRRGIQNDVNQLSRDVAHHNKKHNPGDPIQPSFDFTEDVEETSESTEYIDAPPEDDEGDTPLA